MDGEAWAGTSAATPLAEHGVLRSSSFDETWAFLRAKNYDIQPVRTRSLREHFDAAIGAVYLQHLTVAFMAYGTELEISSTAPLEADYCVHLPLDGWVKIRSGRDIVQRGSGHATIVSPSNHFSASLSGDCRRLLLFVNHQALADCLAAMLGDHPKERLIFDLDTDPSQPCGRRLSHAVRYAAQEFETKDSLDGNGVVMTQFEQYFMTLLLMSQPNNYTEALHRRDNGVRPGDVKRAIDYVHANVERAINIQDLVTVSGVPGRTLQQHFQDFVGTSPMGYIKRIRYRGAHDDLRRSDGEHSVSEIAARWGFSHMSRFAAEYQDRFGELPSATAGRRLSGKD